MNEIPSARAVQDALLGQSPDPTGTDSEVSAPAWLPPANHELSPHTGYAREHWETTADRLVEAAWRWASPTGARLDLPGPPSGSGTESDGLEGFARSFLLAAFRIAGNAGSDPHGWLDRYAHGLASGTASAGALLPDGASAEPWPRIGDHYEGGQPLVESASIALALRLTRPWLWDRLEPEVQEQTVGWLRSALSAVPAPNNWYLFPYTVAGFLESVGRGDGQTRAARARAEELIEEWYQGDGWYSDGEGRAFDHYNGWALHFYPVLDAWLAGEEEVYADSLRTYLSSFGLWFGADGAPVYFGRSMTYRWAAGTAVALGSLVGESPLPPGQSRRILSGSLKYFLDRGAVDDRGLLQLGWHGRHAATVQEYSGPASPLWAAKAFACLLIPVDAPFWTEVETPAPVELADRVLAEAAPGFLIQATAGDGIVRVHNHGSDKLRPYQEAGAARADPLYVRLAYSSATGPTSVHDPADNHVSVIWRGHRSARRSLHPIGAADSGRWGWAASWHRPVFAAGSPSIPGLVIDSYVVACGGTEVRIDQVRGAVFDVNLEHSGWAVSPESDLSSSLVPLHGFDDQPLVSIAHAGTAFVAGEAIVPKLRAEVSGAGTFVCAARLAGPGASRVEVLDVKVTSQSVKFSFVPDDGSQLRTNKTGPSTQDALRIIVDLSARTVREEQA